MYVVDQFAILTSTPDPSWIATAVIALFSSAAFWSYWKDRPKNKADGQVATATVEIQVEAHRVQNLEQRFAFAQSAWDEERLSLNRRIGLLEAELGEERHEREQEKLRHEEKVLLLEARVKGMQRELQELTDEIAQLRNQPLPNGKGG